MSSIRVEVEDCNVTVDRVTRDKVRLVYCMSVVVIEEESQLNNSHGKYLGFC